MAAELDMELHQIDIKGAYLNGKLTFGGQKRELVGYADADGSMAKHRQAMSGYAFLLDGGAVSWSSKRQEIVSLSTTESEYVAASHATKEALWLRSLLKQLFDPIALPTTRYCTCKRPPIPC